MKNIRSDVDDSLRPEYKRSDFGELVRGKYAVTEVEFGQLLHSLLACIGEDEGIKFMHHSTGNSMADHKPGDWSYETDNANQVTLRYWLDEFGNIEEAITNPTSVMTPQDRAELLSALAKGVEELRTKVAALKDRQ
jgi:hypothetical protein